MDYVQLQQRTKAKKEFKSIIATYMLPLFDVRGNLKCEDGSFINKELISVKNEATENYIYFYPRIGTENEPSPFRCKIGIYALDALRRPATKILNELLKEAEYEYCGNFSVKNYYGIRGKRQTSYKRRVLDLAFELGMCQWLVPTVDNAIILHTVICHMLDWSSRTYEGKNVPFGFVIDFNRIADDSAANYLHFLETDSSAVFTDGIFSGILLDKSGKIISFLTRGTTALHCDPNKEIFVPYQFIDIAQHCTGAAIGIIVLANGEILLIKNQAICFAKRGRKWIYFDWSRVYSTLRPYFQKLPGTDEQTVKKKIQAIYCTMLDVSFSHTGACFAIIHPDMFEAIEKENILVDRFDLYISGNPPQGMKAENMEKSKVLSCFLYDSQQFRRSFFEIEKPLRREILSLDGATVVSLSGEFYCAGSIVSVSGSSSGGGRTAAAKQLAKYGVGIKISEDGYIEAYGIPVQADGSLPPKQSSRMIKLFIFK